MARRICHSRLPSAHEVESTSVTTRKLCMCDSPIPRVIFPQDNPVRHSSFRSSLRLHYLSHPILQQCVLHTSHLAILWILSMFLVVPAFASQQKIISYNIICSQLPPQASSPCLTFVEVFQSPLCQTEHNTSNQTHTMTLWILWF